MKKIVFDARMYGLEHAGIGRYIKNLLGAIKEEKKEFSFLLLVKKEKLASIKKELGDFYQYRPLSSPHYSFGEQRELIKAINEEKPNLVHFPHFNLPLFYRGNYVVTIHDLIKHFFKGKETTTRGALFYWPKYFAYRLTVRKAIWGAKKIIVPSHWWKEKLTKIYSLPENKVAVTWEAVDREFFLPGEKAKEILKKHGLTPGKFFLYTGSVYPHKNIKRLIEAMKFFPEERLAIVCSRSVFTDRLERMARKTGLQKQIEFLGFVPDDEMKALYQKAIALVQPSLMEGFGLTGLEAMAAGLPVVSSNASCLPEVYEKGALYFDPLNVEEMTGRMKEISENKELRVKMIERGKTRAAQFSWEKTARETLAVYREAI